METDEYTESVRKAIRGLTDADPEIRKSSLEIFQKFQDPEEFCFSTFVELSNPSSPQDERVAAYTTLTSIIKNHWIKLKENTKLSIANAFPFHKNVNINKDPLISTIARATASFLAFTEANEITTHFFTKFEEDDRIFTLYTFSEFVSFVFQDDFPKSLFSKFKFFNNKQLLPDIMSWLIFDPLVQTDENSPEFSFYLFILSEIHQNSQRIIEKNLANEKILDIYVKLCPLLWEVSNSSLVSIFETILEKEKVPDPIIEALYGSLHNFTSNYSILFYLEDQRCTQNFNDTLQSFHNRLRLLPSLFAKTPTQDFSEFLYFCADLLESIAPSVVFETASILATFLKGQNVMSSAKFKVEGVDARKRIVDVCMAQLIDSITELPGAPLDEGWSAQQVNAQLTEVVKVILENYDFNSVIVDFFNVLSNEMERPNAILIIMKMIASVANEERRGVIGTLCVRAAIDLLSSINTFKSKMQTKVCNFLKQIVPCMEFTEFSEDDFFMELIDLLIESKPISLEPFSNFIYAFVDRFRKVTIPLEKLNSIPAKHPVYPIVTKLVAKFEKPVPEKPSSIELALSELRWLVNEFKPHDKGLRKLSTDVIKALQIISSLSINEWNDYQHNSAIISEICTLLIQCSNVLVETADNNTKSNILNQAISAFTFLGQTLEVVQKAASDELAKCMIQLQSPAEYKTSSVIWLKKIAAPLIHSLYSINNYTVGNCTARICTNYMNIVAKLLNDKEKNKNAQANDVKKIAMTISEFCAYIGNDQCEELLKLCLNINDLGVFQSVINALSKKDFGMLKNLWPILIQKKDQQFIDMISDILLKFLNANSSENVNIYRTLYGVREQDFDQLKLRLGQSSAAKSRRRIFRTFIQSVQKNI